MRPDLTRYAWLSLGAAVFTLLLKLLAWKLTGSVGLLADAAESIVNLVAAVTALVQQIGGELEEPPPGSSTFVVRFPLGAAAPSAAAAAEIVAAFTPLLPA